MIPFWIKYRAKIYILTDQGVVSGVNFLMSILLVRLMGLHDFGAYALILIASQGLLAINQGLITKPFQSLSEDLKQGSSNYMRELAGLQLFYSIMIALLVPIGMYVMIQFGNVKDLPSIGAVTCYLIGYCLFDYSRKLFYARHQIVKTTIKDVVVMVSQGVSVGFLLIMNYQLTLDKVLYVLSACFLLVEFPLFFLQKPLFPSRDVIYKHWMFGKWMIGNAVLQWFSGNLFITAGATIAGSEVAGVIRIGQSIIGVFNVMIQALENYIPPVAARIFSQEGTKTMLHFFMALLQKGVVAILAISILLITFRDEIWTFFYGVDHIEYTYIMYWFAPILLFNFIGFPLRFALRTLQKTRALFEAYVITSFFGFATSSWVVGSYGLHGICFGLLITQVMMQLWYAYRLLPFYNEKQIVVRTT